MAIDTRDISKLDVAPGELPATMAIRAQPTHSGGIKMDLMGGAR